MAVKKKSTAKKPVKKVTKKTSAKKPAKKAVSKKAVAKKSAAKKKTVTKAVKKSAAKKPAKKPVKKASVKKSAAKKTVKKAVKTAAKKSTSANKIVVPPVPVTGTNRSERVGSAVKTPSQSTAPVVAPVKSNTAPKQATSNRVLLAAIIGVVILALVVIARPGSDDDDGAAPEIPAATQSAEPTAEATEETSAQETPAPTTVTSVEAPGRFIGNWKDAERTIMSLTWRAPSATDGLTGYKVESRSNMGEWTVISELPATALSFEVTKTSTEGSTSFRVSSVYSDGQLAEAKAFGFAGQFE